MIGRGTSLALMTWLIAAGLSAADATATGATSASPAVPAPWSPAAMAARLNAEAAPRTADPQTEELDALWGPDVPPGPASATAAGSVSDPRPVVPTYRIAAVIAPEHGLVRGRMRMDVPDAAGLERMELRLRPRIGLLDDASLVVTGAWFPNIVSNFRPDVQISPLGDACTLVRTSPATDSLGSVVIEWKAKLSTTGGGGGLDATGDAGAILYHWYPELARRDAHGAWIPVTATTIPPDVAVADATFTLAVPTGWDVAGAFGATDTPSADGRFREFRWHDPLCHQNALAIGHFTSATCAVGAGPDAITVQSHWLPGDDHGGHRVLAAAAQALDQDARLLGPYPYRHLDIVDADVDEPGFAADGLILLPQHAYPKPLRPRQVAKDLPDDLITFATMQVARLWWSTAIGTDAAREPWLAESLAGCCALDGIAAQEGAPTAATVLEDGLAELRENTQDHDFPLDAALDAFPGDRYPAMRDKGVLVLTALRQQLGDDVFHGFLGDLARDGRGVGIDGAAFRAALARRLGTPAMDAFYARWIHGGALDMASFTAIAHAARSAASTSAAAIAFPSPATPAARGP